MKKLPSKLNMIFLYQLRKHRHSILGRLYRDLNLNTENTLAITTALTLHKYHGRVGCYSKENI